MVKEFYDKGKTLLITNAAGYSVPYNNFASRQFKRLMQDKGWEHRIHDTRHTFISRAKECKLDELYLKRIVGHTTKDITTTVYTHIKQETLLNEIQKLKY